jgi:hypothetical protein
MDTYLDGGPPFLFSVHVRLPRPQPELLREQSEVVRAIVELQKPAHTVARLVFSAPSFRIEINSTVGVDTLIGDEEDADGG